MADDEKPYAFVTEDDKKLVTSKGYNGKVVASYPNGDSYEGSYLDG